MTVNISIVQMIFAAIGVIGALTATLGNVLFKLGQAQEKIRRNEDVIERYSAETNESLKEILRKIEGLPCKNGMVCYTNGASQANNGRHLAGV